MSHRIAEATGVSSTIDVPSDFRDLFERLSFSTKQDDFSVPLKNRGDGLQARHIPHIVEFICSQNRKTNIWAYEEPENSMEMTKSFEVAKQFRDEFSKSNQLFVTSHSPSFYGLGGERVEKFYVSKSPHSDGSLVSRTERFNDVSVADQQLGIAHIIAERTQNIFKEIEDLKLNLNKIRSLSNPVLLTEGKHDKQILEAAIIKTGRDSSAYTVMCCERASGEGGGASTLKQTLENIPAADPNLRFGIFDRDNEGTTAFDGLKKFRREAPLSDFRISPSGRIFGVLLPQTDWDDPYFTLSGKQASIEQMFPRAIIGDDIVAYRFDASSGSIKKVDVDRLLAEKGPEFTKLLVRAKIEVTNKSLAAERILAAPSEAFSNVDQMLSSIDRYIASART